MEVRYQLRFMTGLMYAILASIETNKILAVAFSVLGAIEIVAAHWYNFKTKQARKAWKN